MGVGVGVGFERGKKSLFMMHIPESQAPQLERLRQVQGGFWLVALPYNPHLSVWVSLFCCLCLFFLFPRELYSPSFLACFLHAPKSGTEMKYQVISFFFAN